MTLLALDVGNTRTKWKLFGGAGGSGAFDAAIPTVAELRAVGVGTSGVVCASVRGVDFDSELASYVVAGLNISPCFARTDSRWKDLRNGYKNPSLLGVDRWLAMVGAWHLVASELIVVDAGTAVTVDVVSATGQHLGGYILPGLNAMVDSLNAGTGLIDVGDSILSDVGLGLDTAAAVKQGCLRMLVALINSETFTRPDAKLVLAGGGSQALLPALEADVITRPDLVLEGLYLASGHAK